LKLTLPNRSRSNISSNTPQRHFKRIDDFLPDGGILQSRPVTVVSEIPQITPPQFDAGTLKNVRNSVQRAL
jgi:hypothetical protein